MAVLIRPAIRSDAPGIGRAHAQAWRETYRGILSDEWIAEVSDRERIGRWRAKLTLPSSERRWVAVVGDEIVGFAASGPSREAQPVRDLELISIYLVAAHARKGIGSALVSAAIGDGPAAVWVVTKNVGAQVFYRALGLEPDGATGHVDHWGVDEIRMVR